MPAKKKGRLGKEARRRARWWGAILGWNPNHDSGKGWRLAFRNAAGARPNPKK